MKVVFLDWYKTLSDSVFWEHLKEEDPERYRVIMGSFLGTFGGLIDLWMRGECTSEDIVEKISEDTRLESDYVMRELVRSAREMSFASEKVPGLIEQLRNNNVKVVVATDNMDTFTRWTVPQLQLYKVFDDILNSWEIKALKGDFNGCKSEFFSEFLKRSFLNPSDCVLIDDGEDKKERIQNFGIRYQRIGSTGEVGEVLKKLI